MDITIYETNEIEVKTINDRGQVHYDVITPDQFDRAEELGILSQAQALWTDEVISAYEQYIQSFEEAEE